MLRRVIFIMVIASLSGLAVAQGTTETILFNGFVEGDLVRDQYMFRIGTSTLTLSAFSFYTERLGVYVPGMQKATLTTPLIQPTIGCLVDTLIYERPAMLPARTIHIDVKPGSQRNVIRLFDRTTVTVAILSSGNFAPAVLDPQKILFQKASPISYQLIDRNHDRVRDLILSFRVADLLDLTAATTQVVLTAVDTDGTSLVGLDDVVIQGTRPAPQEL